MTRVMKMFIIGYLLIEISMPWYITAKPVDKKEVERLIKVNKPSFVKYVDHLISQWSWFEWGGRVSKFVLKCFSEMEARYAPAAEAFFENKGRVKQEVQATGEKEHDIEYLCNLINYYKQQGSRKDDLPRILHEKNIEDLSLPHDINQATLKRYPDKLCFLVRNGKISTQEYYRNVTLNIFMKFLVDNRLLS